MEVDHPGRRLTLVFFAIAVALASFPVPGGQLGVVSQNLDRLFDDIDDRNDAPPVSTRRYRERLARIADLLANEFDSPHLIALQEVENRSVLQQLAKTIHQRHGLSYRPLMAPKTGSSPINSGYLVRPQLTVRGLDAMFTEQRFASAEPLFSRPPLRLDVCYAGACVTVLNLHLRSMRGLGSNLFGRRVAAKRRQQAMALAAWIDRQQQADPARKLMLLGDFNALTPSDRHVDVLGIISGAPDNLRTRLDSPDLVARDLVDLTRRIPHKQRYSYIFRGKKQQLDYLLASQPLARGIRHIRYHRIDYALSDHGALYARFRWP